MHKTFLLAPALAFLAAPVAAQSLTDDLVAKLRSEGFTRIEIDRNWNTTEVEAIRGTEKVELLLDNETGEVLRSETDRVDDDDLNDDDLDDDRDEDDDDDDRDDDSDDDRDDDHDDDDDDSDDDGDDDHGGGDDDGGDDDGDDD